MNPPILIIIGNLLKNNNKLIETLTASLQKNE